MSNKTTLTFYSGLDTIGGTVMALSYGNDRIIMEMGNAYDPLTDIYNKDVLYRKRSFLQDALWLTTAPKIDGIYAKNLLGDSELIPAEASNINTAVFISHLHLDHMCNMGLVSPLVKVYISQKALMIENSLDTIGKGIISQRNNYDFLEDKKPVKIGAIQVIPFLLNDDSFQDYSFYIKTPDLKIHFTGDLFVYGKYRKPILREIAYLKKENIDILVCEGTSFMDSIKKRVYPNPDEPICGTLRLLNGLYTKNQLDKRIISIIKAHQDLCFINFYQREMSDVQDFEAYAKETDRCLVYEPDTAYLINDFFHRAVNIYLPDSAYYLDNDAKWLKQVLEYNHLITQKELKDNGHKYLVELSYQNTLELLDYIDIKTSYLHHSGEPLGEYDPAFKQLNMILKKTNTEYINLFDDRFFAHAYPNQIQYYINAIDPKILIPVHTLNRDRFQASKHGKRILVELNHSYYYDNEELLEVKNNEH